MTPQEIQYQGKRVYVTGIVSKSGNIHTYVKRYVARSGLVIGQSKNGMLLIKFTNKRYQTHTRCIPAGCVTLLPVRCAGQPRKFSK